MSRGAPLPKPKPKKRPKKKEIPDLFADKEIIIKAPWKDWRGNDIYDGSIIKHPSGEIGKVIFNREKNDACDQWKVFYKSGDISRLCLQIGDKGQAIVIGRLK